MTDNNVSTIPSSLVTLGDVPFSGISEESANDDPFSLDFEELLILQLEELQNQDPLDPQDTGEMTQELAAMSSVSEQSETNDQLSDIREDQNSLLDELISAQSAQNGTLEQLATLEEQSQENMNAISETQNYLLELQSISNLNSEQSLAIDLVGSESLVSSNSATMSDGVLEVSYSLLEDADFTTISIKDKNGNLISTIDGKHHEGLHTFEWDGIADDGTQYTEGEFNISVVTETFVVKNDVSGTVEYASNENLHALNNGSLAFHYNLDKQASSAIAEIYDANGNLLSTMDMGVAGGEHNATWNGLTQEGNLVDPNGTYQVVVTAIGADGNAVNPQVSIVTTSDTNNLQFAGDPVTVDYIVNTSVDRARITVYDDNGDVIHQKIEGVTDENNAGGINAGNYQFTWDGTTTNGGNLAEGSSYSIAIETFSGDMQVADSETFIYEMITGVQSIGTGSTYLETARGNLVLLDSAISVRSA
ncbi:MAG: hypothetical protein MK137_04210 [Rickettsiales bacterium]|nr:hypothetical protein [Rickettsiales bacterium]